MNKNLLLVFLSILSIKGVFALDTFNLMVYHLPNPSVQMVTTNYNQDIDTSSQSFQIIHGLTTTYRLDSSFDFIFASENRKPISATNTNLFSLEDTGFIYYEKIGRNIISNTLNLRTNNPSFTNKKPNIFNHLGLFVKTIPLNNSEIRRINVSNLYKGLYYRTIPNLNVEPLKFVKVN
jgi:hypothetical protein